MPRVNSEEEVSLVRARNRADADGLACGKACFLVRALLSLSTLRPTNQPWYGQEGMEGGRDRGLTAVSSAVVVQDTTDLNRESFLHFSQFTLFYEQEGVELEESVLRVSGKSEIQKAYIENRESAGRFKSRRYAPTVAAGRRERERSDAARCCRRLRIFFLVQGLDHHRGGGGGGDASVVAAVGRRRREREREREEGRHTYTRKEEGFGLLSLPCSAGRGRSCTHRPLSVPPFPWDQLFSYTY